LDAGFWWWQAGAFENGRKATTNIFRRNRFDGARIDLRHAAVDFFMPSGSDGRLVRIVEAFA
jgi:hypothetical protein